MREVSLGRRLFVVGLEVTEVFCGSEKCDPEVVGCK